MTETEWLCCDEPETLLEFVRSQTTARKCRLLAAAFCRHVLPLIGERCSRRAVEAAEQYADGLVSLEDMLAIKDQVLDVYVNLPNPSSGNTEPPLSFKAESIALQSTAFATMDTDNYLDACCRATYLATLRWALLRAAPDEAVAPYNSLIQWQLLLIKDLIGNPFRLVTIDPSWLTTNVITLSEAIYQEREFDRLPLLADALEKVGCNDANILNHCRQPGEHVRGCWLVDLILGKK